MRLVIYSMMASLRKCVAASAVMCILVLGSFPSALAGAYGTDSDAGFAPSSADRTRLVEPSPRRTFERIVEPSPAFGAGRPRAEVRPELSGFYFSALGILSSNLDYGGDVGHPETRSDQASGYLFSYGYAFSDYFQVEYAYSIVDDYSNVRPDGEPGTGTRSRKSKMDMNEVAWLLRWDGPTLSPYARLAFARADVDDELIDKDEDGGDSITRDSRRSNWIYGLGVDLDLTYSTAIRAEYTYGEVGSGRNEDLNRFILGLVVRL